MVSTEIRLITFFVAKDGKAVYSQQKQDLKLIFGSNHQLLIAKFRFKIKVYTFFRHNAIAHLADNSIG